MAIRHAVWHSDKCYKYKWQAALSCAVHAFKECMDKPKTEQIKSGTIQHTTAKDPWKVTTKDQVGPTS